MPNVAQSVGACTAAASCHAEARAKRPFRLGRVPASTSSCGAFTLKGRDGAGCCCSWRTRPASGSLPRPAAGDIFAWWVHPGALGSRTSGCAQMLDKEGLAYIIRLVLFMFRLGTRLGRLGTPAATRGTDSEPGAATRQGDSDTRERRLAAGRGRRLAAASRPGRGRLAAARCAAPLPRAPPLPPRPLPIGHTP